MEPKTQLCPYCGKIMSADYDYDSNEIRQTMVTIHKLHLSINAVNSILNFNSDSIATEKERARNNYYNYWI